MESDTNLPERDNYPMGAIDVEVYVMTDDLDNSVARLWKAVQSETPYSDLLGMVKAVKDEISRLTIDYSTHHTS